MRFVLIACLLAAMAGVVGAWVLPVEFFQNWNVARAGADPYGRFEAAGQAEFLLWLARCGLSLTALALAMAVRQSDRFAAWCVAVLKGFRVATEFTTTVAGLPAASPWRSTALRSGVLVWLGLFAWHALDALAARGRDWPVYRLRSGDEVLPNISLRNRQVIRYLQQVVREDARILVCSDQSVFFLSYYLRPRRVFHFIHPDAEFAIPQPGESRPVYRLDELTAEQFAAVRPDYILEYYEGEGYVGSEQGLYRERLDEDPRWTAYWRQSEQTTGTPPFLVVLRSVGQSNTAGGARSAPGALP
jgi:hypothetical protein